MGFLTFSTFAVFLLLGGVHSQQQQQDQGPTVSITELGGQSDPSQQQQGAFGVQVHIRQEEDDQPQQQQQSFSSFSSFGDGGSGSGSFGSGSGSFGSGSGSFDSSSSNGEASFGNGGSFGGSSNGGEGSFDASIGSGSFGSGNLGSFSGIASFGSGSGSLNGGDGAAFTRQFVTEEESNPRFNYNFGRIRGRKLKHKEMLLERVIERELAELERVRRKRRLNNWERRRFAELAEKRRRFVFMMGALGGRTINQEEQELVSGGGAAGFGGFDSSNGFGSNGFAGNNFGSSNSFDANNFGSSNSFDANNFGSSGQVSQLATGSFGGQVTRNIGGFAMGGNLAQLDTDGDGIPDSVDNDDDNDGIPDEWDYQPTVYSTRWRTRKLIKERLARLRLDSDFDGVPDVVDNDDDNDGIPDQFDVNGLNVVLSGWRLRQMERDRALLAMNGGFAGTWFAGLPLWERRAIRRKEMLFGSRFGHGGFGYGGFGGGFGRFNRFDRFGRFNRFNRFGLGGFNRFDRFGRGGFFGGIGPRGLGFHTPGFVRRREIRRVERLINGPRFFPG